MPTFVVHPRDRSSALFRTEDDSTPSTVLEILVPYTVSENIMCNYAVVDILDNIAIAAIITLSQVLDYQ